MIELNGYTFDLTCGACPEQYDVYKDGEQVAYVRLRWGTLRVDVPDTGGTEIYSHEFEDEYKGCFDSDEERNYFLEEIAAALDIYENSQSI